jgi:hypothetical protein
VTTSEVLDLIGGLVSALKTYSAKLPAVVPLSVVPGGMRPTPEAVEAYEQTVYRFRTQSGVSVYRGLTAALIESLEAFEGGRLLSAIQPLLLTLEHLERMHRDKEISVTPADEKRLGEYRNTLHRIMPGKEPELEGAGKGMDG